MDGKYRDGSWKEFNKRGVLIADGVYVSNKKHGLWREYYDHTETLMIEENYDHGVQHGRYASFHPNGRILSEGQFFHGSRVGQFKIHDEQGRHIRSLFFLNNVLVEDRNELRNVNETPFERVILSERKTGT